MNYLAMRCSCVVPLLACSSRQTFGEYAVISHLVTTGERRWAMRRGLGELVGAVKRCLMSAEQPYQCGRQDSWVAVKRFELEEDLRRRKNIVFSYRLISRLAAYEIASLSHTQTENIGVAAKEAKTARREAYLKYRRTERKRRKENYL